MKHAVEEVSLNGGAKGILINIPDAPVMTFNFNFRAGYYTAPENKWEVPHVLEHLMFNGNKHYRTAQEFQIALEKNGAYANAFTSGWYVGYDSECAEFESMRILELVLQSLSSPLFLEEEFKAEMGNVREELSGYLNNYFRVLNLAMMENANLLALNDSARIKQMKNVVRQDMFDHHEKTHTQQNMRFVIGGRTKQHKDEIISLIETYSAQLPTGERIELPAEAPTAKKEAIVLQRQDVEKLHYYFDMYLPNYRLNKQELGVGQIVERILTRSFTSKIFGEVRRKGLAYGINSSATSGTNSSRWWFGGNVSNTNALPLFEVIIREVKNIAEGNITDDEIESAKLQALGNFQRSSQKVSDIVRGYEGLYYFEGEIDDYEAIPDEIKSVTKEQVVSHVKRFVDESAWDLGVLGRIDEQLPKDLINTCHTLFE